MAILIYGQKNTTGKVDELFIKCPACEVHRMADVMVYSSYYHFFFIPVLPTARKVHIICQACGLKRYDLPFDPMFIPDFAETKRKFPHPIYTYTVSLFLLFLIIVMILTGH